MKSTQNTQGGSDKKKNFAMGATCLGVVAAGFLIFQTTLQNKGLTAINVSAPVNFSLAATVENRAGTENILPGGPAKDFLVPYRLNASIKLSDETYRDFVFMIDAAGAELSVIADGFRARDLVSISMNGIKVLENIPADWSGRLQLYAPIPDKKFVKACVDVTGKNAPVGICHTISERKTS